MAVAVGVFSAAAFAAQPDDAPPVSTRARLASSFEEPGGKLYARLKLLPRSKVPFTTQTFRLPYRALVADVPEGSWVRFTAKHIDGENTLTSIRAIAECKRFQPCDSRVVTPRERAARSRYFTERLRRESTEEFTSGSDKFGSCDGADCRLSPFQT